MLRNLQIPALKQEIKDNMEIFQLFLKSIGRSGKKSISDLDVTWKRLDEKTKSLLHLPNDPSEKFAVREKRCEILDELAQHRTLLNLLDKIFSIEPESQIAELEDPALEAVLTVFGNFKNLAEMIDRYICIEPSIGEPVQPGLVPDLTQTIEEISQLRKLDSFEISWESGTAVISETKPGLIVTKPTDSISPEPDEDFQKVLATNDQVNLQPMRDRQALIEALGGTVDENLGEEIFDLDTLFDGEVREEVELSDPMQGSPEADKPKLHKKATRRPVAKPEPKDSSPAVSGNNGCRQVDIDDVRSQLEKLTSVGRKLSDRELGLKLALEAIVDQAKPTADS